MKKKEYINCNNISLDEWLYHISIPEKERKINIIDYQFATINHYDEYIRTIANRDIKPILKLFLIDNVYLNSDQSIKDSILSSDFQGREKMLNNSEFIQRLFSLNPPWISIKWIIDLLPNYPQLAIQSIKAYDMAHIQYLPDGRVTGLSDAIDIIKAKYMEHSLPVRTTLLKLISRDFELLVGFLYYKKGYKIKITSKTRDGGYDVLAEKNNRNEYEKLYIECKLYSGNVGVPVIRSILGVLNIDNATKSVVVASSYFTKPASEAAKKSKRIELLDIESFDHEMRTNIDYNWVYKIQEYIETMKKEYIK